MSVSIVRAAPADLDDLVGLVAEFYKIDGHSFVAERVSTALRPLLEDDELGVVWVARSGKVSVGYALVTWGYSLESDGRDALIDEIYARRRGRGVGSALIDRILDDCRSRGLGAIYLETESVNDGARRLYLRHGFLSQDSVWMSRRL